MPQVNNLHNLEKKIGVNFDNPDLLNQVFVHRSYLNEHPDFGLGHNERLEFLGDAVLELVVTEYLYKKFNKPEGELTSLRSSIVRGAMLSNISKDLELGSYLLLSKGEEKSGGKARELILANTFEALIGAIYLDQGYSVTEKFIHNVLLIHLGEIIKQELYKDPKSTFQEWAQERKSITPSYKVIEESGPDHDRKFVIGVYLSDELIATGRGASKQKAQEDAAAKALNKYKA